MADRAPTQRPTTHTGSALLRKLQVHVGSNSSQLVGLSTLLIYGSILLLPYGDRRHRINARADPFHSFDHHFKPHMGSYKLSSSSSLLLGS
ncbi:hypothetical protein OIU74_023885 [Salix koriyanagi]|uniref:Uncharacterized protein n=1 Tax=Salix koriyanagi TaxID=2511006 RepID=A0A9Q1ABK4_9ROSI|nr:hypothetical protein OIU74_023885 [Salix koriyanagi]